MAHIVRRPMATRGVWSPSTCRKLTNRSKPFLPTNNWAAAYRHGVVALHGSRGGGRRRHLHAAVYMIPGIYIGLLASLYVWKSVMMIAFQNAIIYNPYLPPNARSMRIADFVRQTDGVQWREERIRSLDGTELALCCTKVSSLATGHRPRTPVYILYLQGNASSLPPRLPGLSAVLRRLREDESPADYHMACISYRGYWNSHDRPSEKGVNMDVEAALRWITREHETNQPGDVVPRPVVVVWGQSIGSGFATNLAASTSSPPNLQIDALVLETPFTSIKDMLREIYPQKWLPYRYLWPFARTQLDSLGNFEKIAKKESVTSVHLIEAANDELVPADHGKRLELGCKDVGLSVQRHRVRGAFHNGAMERPDGRSVIAKSILSAVALARES